MSIRLTPALLTLAIAGSLATAGAAQARGLCFDREFSDAVVIDVDVGWDRPDPLDPNPQPVVATPDREKLLTALRALKTDWKTPSEMWTRNSVTVEFFETGLIVCQAVYSRDRIYVMDRDLNGFVVRGLTVNELYDLNDALGIR